MNQMYELNLNDLRRLGRFGDVTAKLQDKTIAELRRDGIYISHDNAIIDGKKCLVKMREDYVKVFPKIRTIKRGKHLIAERRDNKLVATYKYKNSQG